VDEIVRTGEPDFPFCLCWANENWTRAWDGGANKILMEQHYSDEDDRAHIRHLLPTLADRRYICVDGRPVLLVYRSELMPEPRRTADIWRDEVARAGLPGLYLVRVESFNASIRPADIGFDAALEFAPDWRAVQPRVFGRRHRLMARLGMFPGGMLRNRIFDYSQMARAMAEKPAVSYRRIRSVTPSWDNSARRAEGATIFLGSTPELYGDWLYKTISLEQESRVPEEQQIVFINAWNEWAEGNHLEPDQRWGTAYLEATRRALNGS
jgi:lipopolysaccharide biosynthesis protein